jgi:hypothetical protein
MKKIKRIFIESVILALLPLSAHAYFDPGSGVVILQVLIAGGLGLLFRFRTYIMNIWKAILRLLRL